MEESTITPDEVLAACARLRTTVDEQAQRIAVLLGDKKRLVAELDNAKGELSNLTSHVNEHYFAANARASAAIAKANEEKTLLGEAVRAIDDRLRVAKMHRCAQKAEAILQALAAQARLLGEGEGR